MQQPDKELGITLVLLERFEKQILPDALWIKDKVDKGELLSDGDIEFLEQVLQNAVDAKERVDHHPELQTLYADAVNLYEEITAKGLANQQAVDAMANH